MVAQDGCSPALHSALRRVSLAALSCHSVRPARLPCLPACCAPSRPTHCTPPLPSQHSLQDRVSPAWEMIPAARHIFLMLCNPLHSVTAFELPVYHPSEEERKDPKLYAHNVRKLMVRLAVVAPRGWLRGRSC